MKILVTVLFLVLSTSICSFAQIEKSDLWGTWINTKTDMKDGSKLIPVYPDYIRHIRMNFHKNKMEIDYYPAQNKGISGNSYLLKNDLIFLSNQFGYTIEKITKDSLIIVEKMNWFEDDQLKRFYLVKKEKLDSLEKAKNKNNKHLTANPFYTPEFKQSLQLYLSEGLKKKYSNLKLKGSLTILLDKKNVEVKITFRDHNDPIKEQIITKLLKKSFKKWNLEGFEEYTSITIGFVILMEKTKYIKGLRVALNTNSFNQLLGLYGLTYEQLFDGNKYFKLGLNSYQEEDYENAISYFTKSFELNHTKTEALYNRALVFLKLNKFDKACSDWKTLKDLGQKQGEKLFNENCSAVME